jgi:hypothetical protein
MAIPLEMEIATKVRTVMSAPPRPTIRPSVHSSPNMARLAKAGKTNAAPWTSGV